ncbi:MAG: hypothetical protein ACM3H7_02380 [Acidobacteriaceae bacterium]
MRTRRGLFLALVIGTMIIFVALVWLIARNVPRYISGNPTPSYTSAATRFDKNCTNPVSYWRDHPELYPPELVLGKDVYQARDISGMLLNTGASLNSQLQAQLIGAFLNILSGSEQAPVESTLFQAYDWLVQHPDGSEVTAGEEQAGSRLSDALQAYNLGLSGVTPCQPGQRPETSGNGSPSGAASSPSASPTGLARTPSPSPSPSASNQPLQTIVFPSATRSPTREETIKPQPTSTDTPEPTEEPVKPTLAPPTNTPVNTTAAPEPTDTPVPPSPTLPPEPTITPTFPTIPG